MQRVILSILLLLCIVMPSPATAADCVVLLHGLARSAKAMKTLAARLEESGYRVANIDYPSRDFPIEQLAPEAIERGLAACRQEPVASIHFVTHSLGGILVRYYLAEQSIPELGRVVMLAPPNRGSEVVDALADQPGYDFINGPAGRQLGTGPGSVPLQLGPADFEVGIIAGDRSINMILSAFLPDPDDGKVSVARTRLDGMRDFIVLPVAHPFIMKDEQAIRQAIRFLASGRFDHAAEPESSPFEQHTPLP